MAYRGEAFDFTLFEDRMGNTVPNLEPRVSPQPKRNVVELPERPEHKSEHKPEHRPSHKRNPLRMAAAVVCFAVMFLAALTAVESEVQLTELTEEINETQVILAEAQSLEIQLSMQAAQKMTDAQVEEYAMQTLGMTKLSSTQVTYLHVAQQDKGTVVQDLEGGSFLDEVFAWIRGVLAG